MSYEATKSFAIPLVAPQYVTFAYMFAASIGEIVSAQYFILLIW